MRLLHRGNYNHPPFPSISDLPDLSPEDAARALRVLQGLVLIDAAELYTRPQSKEAIKRHVPPRWNVWLNITQRRVELEAWASEWLAKEQARQQRYALPGQEKQPEQQQPEQGQEGA